MKRFVCMVMVMLGLSLAHPPSPQPLALTLEEALQAMAACQVLSQILADQSKREPIEFDCVFEEIEGSLFVQLVFQTWPIPRARYPIRKSSEALYKDHYEQHLSRLRSFAAPCGRGLRA